MATKISKVHISDAKALVKLGLLPGNISSAEEELRKCAESPDIRYLITQSQGRISCLARIRYSSFANNVDLSLNIPAEDREDSKEILDSILRYLFLEKDIHKISIILFMDNLFLEDTLTCSGFIQEAVLKDEVRNGQDFEDAGLFCLLRPDFRGYNYCFVPFELGVVIAGGGADEIDRVELLHYGDKIEDPFIRDVAAHSGYLDEEGRILKNKDDLYKLDDKASEFLPGEVWKAYCQLTEYFEKTRSSFTIRYKMDNATPFQKKVWEALTNISYGNMRSYEDIANDIADSPSQARHLTRAVGAACSDNPYPIIIPCHRVIGKDGTLVGYAAGLDIKDFLLTHETFTYIMPLKGDGR